MLTDREVGIGMTETPDTAHPKRFRVRRPQDNRGQPGAQGPGAAGGPERATESLKEEVAEDLGLADDLRDPDRLTVREAGKIGGQMVRRLVEEGKQSLARGTRADRPDETGR